jgi:hypothetical protein
MRREELVCLEFGFRVRGEDVCEDVSRCRPVFVGEPRGSVAPGAEPRDEEEFCYARVCVGGRDEVFRSDFVDCDCAAGAAFSAGA